MSLRFILGRPGTGKTTLCLREIESRVNSGRELFFLIPEQFSLHAEKLLLRNRRASVNAQALSFNRLAYRIFAKLGGPKGKILDEAGRNMLLRKVMFECGDELVYYKNTADKQGFIDKLARAVTEFNHYRVTPGDLRLRVPESDDALGGKLSDLALILEKYRRTVTDQYLLTDDMLELLCKRLQNEDILHGSYFWADGFYSFTPQELQVLRYLIKNAAEITFSLTYAQGDSLFTAAQETVHQLRGIAKELNIPVLPEIYMNENYRHANAPGLRAFTERFSVVNRTKPADGYEPGAVAGEGAITVLSARDAYEAAYEAARRCLVLVNDRHYRFRDIAILCGEGAGQKKILHTVFDRYKIPLFQDTPAGVLSHPLTELIRAALEIIARNWTYEGVMRFLKTGLTTLSTDEVDKLENYILAHGIKSYKWKYPFAEEMENARLRVLSCLADFENQASDFPRPGAKDSAEFPSRGNGAIPPPLFARFTVADFCRRVTDMLYRLNVPEKLAALYRERMDADDPDTARIHRQIWPKICGTLDKLAEILGGERVSLRVFAKLFDAGLAQTDLGRIPPTVDQVFLGDASRTRFPPVKAMIVVGANDGRLPALSVTEELLSGTEREQLENTALPLAPESASRMNNNWYALYCALCQPSEELTLIYAENEGGKILRPSPLIGRMKALLPGIPHQRVGETAHAASAPAHTNTVPNPAQNYSASAPARRVPAPPAAGFTLSRETTQKLYGKTVITAASRLERYASCPFAYYAAYNLNARERKIYDVNPADLGTLYHAVVEEFSKTLEAAGREWGSLSRSEITAYVNACVEKLSAEPGHILRNTARNLNVLNKVKRICVTSIQALCEHVKRGTYKPSASEVAFSPHRNEGDAVAVLEVQLSNERKLLLTGRIDRVDLLRTENGCYAKIIDYKSGRVKFDLAEVMQGTQLQLILYMNALAQASQEALKPGGVFYFHLDDPVLDEDDNLDAERREEKLLECFKMSGLVVTEPDSVNGMDVNIAKTGRSKIIPVAVNKDGSYSKSSSVATPEYFETLGKMVQDKIKELGLNMTEGVIVPEPLQKGKTSACDYCKYDTICGYSSI